MIFGKHINRYYLKYAFWLIAGLAALVLVDFLQSQGEVEIVSDALAWDWPLLLELLGRDGLPATVRGCREDVQLLAGVDPQAIPHHALLDARLMAGLPLHSQAPYGME